MRRKIDRLERKEILYQAFKKFMKEDGLYDGEMVLQEYKDKTGLKISRSNLCQFIKRENWREKIKQEWEEDKLKKRVIEESEDITLKIGKNYKTWIMFACGTSIHIISKLKELVELLIIQSKNVTHEISVNKIQNNQVERNKNIDQLTKFNKNIEMLVNCIDKLSPPTTGIDLNEIVSMDGMAVDIPNTIEQLMRDTDSENLANKSPK